MLFKINYVFMNMLFTYKNFMQNNTFQFKSLFQILLILISLGYSSCVTQRKSEYLRSTEAPYSEYNVTLTNENRTLVPGDELYIQVSSFTSSSASGGNSSAGAETSATNITPFSAVLVSYKINKDSTIIFPLIGTVKIAGKTIPQATSLIQSLLTSYLNAPSVNMKLVNINISVLGEVKNPGNFTYTNQPLNIFQALSYAGDVTEYGDRSFIKVIRQKDKKVVVYILDLTKNDIITSKNFYMESNDVIFVRPLKSKIWGMDKFPYEMMFSAISAIILVVTYIHSTNTH